MDITLYSYTGDKNKINKELSGGVSLNNGTLRESSNVVEPDILIGTNPEPYNYAYIPQFGRYYWITNPEMVRTGLYRIRLKSDPLKSFASEILALSCFCIRTENYEKHEPFIIDGNAQYNSCDWVMTYRPKTFTEGSFKILVTAG